MTTPFIYPAVPHVRRHGPMGYADVTSFRPWLRDEFSFRCVYCLLREQWDWRSSIQTSCTRARRARRQRARDIPDRLLVLTRAVMFASVTTGSTRVARSAWKRTTGSHGREAIEVCQERSSSRGER